jgi:RNA polymerase sigma factor (sigma-70 family)
LCLVRAAGAPHERLAAAQKDQFEFDSALAGEERFELLERLRAALARIAPRERELIWLYFHAGLTQQQIGARLAQSQRTVCRRLANTLETMRYQLSRQKLDSQKA